MKMETAPGHPQSEVQREGGVRDFKPGHLLYGVVRLQCEPDTEQVDRIRERVGRDRAEWVTCDGWGIWLGVHLENIPRDRQELVDQLQTHQLLLESSLPLGVVLPLAFGSTVTDAESAVDFLWTHRDDLTEAAGRIQGCCEIDVAVLWQADTQVARDLAEADEQLSALIRELRTQMQAGDSDEQYLRRARLEVGASMQRLLNEESQRRMNRIREALRDQVQQSLVHDPTLPKMLGSVACLVCDGGQAAVMETVNRFDELWGDELLFRVVGPLPAHSFCTLRVRRASWTDMMDAAGDLEIEIEQVRDGSMDWKDLRSAFLLAARSAHPDGGGSPDGFTRVKEAHVLLDRAVGAVRRGGTLREGITWLENVRGPGEIEV
jgi:hypothetical protein